MMKITSEGGDELGKFTIQVPGHCGTCDTYQDMVVTYNTISLTRGLRARKIEAFLPSSIYRKGKSIGVTCGCYARFQRQVAHIERKRSGKRAT